MSRSIRRAIHGSISFLAAAGAAAILASCAASASPRSPFLDRSGRTFAVEINGAAPAPIEELEIEDLNGARVRTVHSAALVEGKVCFTAEPLDQELGGFKQLSLQVVEINRERPSSRWREFRALPAPEGSGDYPLWLPKMEYCPEEFILTERLRFKTLPVGRYVFTVRFNGTKNWDAKDILVEVR